MARLSEAEMRKKGLKPSPFSNNALTQNGHQTMHTFDPKKK